MRAALALICVILLVGGCSSDGHTELTSSDDIGYRSVAWLGDTVYYIAFDSHDLKSDTALMRIRPGGRPEPVPFAAPGCMDARDPYAGPSWLVPTGERELGILLFCYRGDDAEFRRIDDSGRPVGDPVALQSTGSGVAWTGETGTVYAPVKGCGIKAFGGPADDCFGGDDARLPVVGAGGAIHYVGSRCGAGEPAPDGTWTVCRHDGAGREVTLGRGVDFAQAMDVRGGRIAISATIGGDKGLWLLDGGPFTKLAGGFFNGVALSPDGSRVAAPTERGRGKWTLRVYAVPG